MSRRYKRKTGIGVIAFVVLCICGIVSYKRIELNQASAKAKKEIANLEDKLKSEQERTEEIKKEEAYMQTYKYIEDIARTKLGLVYKDEILFEKTE